MASKPIKAIDVKFRQHLLAENQQAHHKLNTQCATLIADINDLFSNNERVNIPEVFCFRATQSVTILCLYMGLKIQPLLQRLHTIKNSIVTKKAKPTNCFALSYSLSPAIFCKIQKHTLL